MAVIIRLSLLVWAGQPFNWRDIVGPGDPRLPHTGISRSTSGRRGPRRTRIDSGKIRKEAFYSEESGERNLRIEPRDQIPAANEYIVRNKDPQRDVDEHSVRKQTWTTWKVGSPVRSTR